MSGRLALAAIAAFGMAALLAVGVTATRWQSAEALTNCSTDTAGLDGEELAALQLINDFRAQNGQPAMLVAPSLNQMAAWKSADSSNQIGPNFSHTDSLDRTPYTRAGDCGYPGGAAENIAAGYASAQTVVQAWINSDGHRRNLLGSYAVMGIGRTGSSWVLNLGFAVEPGSYPVPGSAGAAPPVTSQPNSTPAPRQGGGTNPPAQTPTQEAPQAEPAASQASNGLVPRTVLPGGNYPAWKLPANVPVKRAMMQMVAAE